MSAIVAKPNIGILFYICQYSQKYLKYLHQGAKCYIKGLCNAGFLGNMVYLFVIKW